MTVDHRRDNVTVFVLVFRDVNLQRLKHGTPIHRPYEKGRCAAKYDAKRIGAVMKGKTAKWLIKGKLITEKYSENASWQERQVLALMKRYWNYCLHLPLYE